MGEVTRSKRRRLEEEAALRQHLPPGGGGREEEDDAGRLDLISHLPDDVLGGVITLLGAPQHLPPGGGGGEEDDAGRVDLISRLPDDVLGSVITLLPAKDGARTQALSRRWRPLWRAAPLNLEADSFAAAQAILGSHQRGPGRRFSLTWRDHMDGFSVVDDVLRPPGLDGLQEFELRYSPLAIEEDFRFNPAPLSVFRFSPTLRVLTVHCHRRGLKFPAEAAACCHALDLPRLEQLTLKGVVISESTLHGILSRCPVLQSLVLLWNSGYRHLRISSPTLRSLGIWSTTSHEAMLEQVTIEDAPLFERLTAYGVYGQQIRVIRAPKLKILGYLADCISEPEFRVRILKKMEFLSLPNSNAMRTVTVLALDIAPENPDVVIDFLTWFPCVEKLHIAMSHWKKMGVRGKPKIARRHVSLECLDQHLKMLELRSYRGDDMWEVSLVRFFLSSARVLESLKFVADRGKEYNTEWIATQLKKIRWSSRTSRGAKVRFVPNLGHRLSTCAPMKHMHNLALEDPFDTSSCTCLNDEWNSYF